MANTIKKQLEDISNDAAKKLNLTKYTLNLNLNPTKGDKVFGELYQVSINDEETEAIYQLVVKKAPIELYRRSQNSIETAYRNEIIFYSQIYPTLRKFEKDHQVSEPFTSIPYYITSSDKIGEEILVLLDLRKQGFVLREKDFILDDNHARLIFQTYAHFHAISFCLKDQKPEEFARLTNSFTLIWDEFSTKGGLIEVITKCLLRGWQTLNPVTEKAIIDKLKKYLDNTKEIYMESLVYKGKHSGILHGDCWTNNMMFKYADENTFSDLLEMKFLDFQLINVGTPVYDLSYFFYTGGSKTLFDRLEDYLDLYHQSFSATARNLGGNPEELLPRHVLTEDWKQYSKFGMMHAMLLTKIKLTSKDNVLEMIDVDRQPFANVNGGEIFMKIKYNEELFNQRVRDILIHMYEIDAL